MSKQLFIGTFPAGRSYADRWHVHNGDYKPLAFLAWDTLKLTIEKGCPAKLAAIIRDDAAQFQAMPGQQVKVSQCGQTVLLGSAILDKP